MSDKDQDAFKASGTSPTYRLVARVVSIGRSAAGAVLERSRATVAARRRFTKVSSDFEDTAHAEPVKGLNRRAFLKSAGMTAVAGAVGTGTTSTQPALFREAEREVEQDPIDSSDQEAREDAWCEWLGAPHLSCLANGGCFMASSPVRGRLRSGCLRPRVRR